MSYETSTLKWLKDIRDPATRNALTELLANLSNTVKLNLASDFQINGTEVTFTAEELNAMADGSFAMSRAALAATGSDDTDAAVISTQVVAVTGSDGTKGVALPAAATTTAPILVVNTVTTAGNTLKVYPVSGGNDAINGGAEDAAFVLGPGKSAWFVATSATQWYAEDFSAGTLTTAEANYLAGITPGTQAASKAVVPDANVNSGVSKVTELHIGASGSEVQLTANPAEVNRACDLSARLVAITATGAVTEADHEGRDLYVTGTAANTQTLPEATGSGGRYRFVIGEVNTNGTAIVVADTTNANFIGSVNILDLDAAAQAAYGCPANCDTITLNGTTTGGQLGDFIELIDVATDVWLVFGQLQCPTGSNPATPFSAAV